MVNPQILLLYQILHYRKPNNQELHTGLYYHCNVESFLNRTGRPEIVVLLTNTLVKLEQYVWSKLRLRGTKGEI